MFERFYSARSVLKDEFGVEVEDDEWFDDAAGSAATADFCKVVGERFMEMARRKKGDSACVHDSICLQWIADCRQRAGNENVWLVTRDHTLPSCVPAGCEAKSLAVTLDALLQWVSPIAVGENTEMEMDIAIAYSKVIESRVLPQERIFNLEDFLIFHELHMTCRALPAEDVEGCVRHIKRNAPNLNPLDAIDRETLAHSIAGYFANPSRKYQEELAKYETEISAVKEDLGRERERSLRTGAWLRVSHIGMLWLVIEIAIVLLSSNYGVGENFFQKVVQSWPLLVGAVPLCALISWFYVGRNRLRALGWPMTKILKAK